MQLGWNRTDGEGSITARAYSNGPEHHRFDDLRVLEVLDTAIDGLSRDQLIAELSDQLSLAEEQAEATFERLVEKGLLLPADHENFERSEEWFEKDWRRGLYYHLGTQTTSIPDVGPDDPPEFDPTDVGFSDDERIDLPEPEPFPDRPLNEVLLSRRTSRQFTGNEMSLVDVSTVLHHAFDPVREARERLESSGEVRDERSDLRPLAFEAYPVIMRCSDLDSGLYRYSIQDHALAPVPGGEFEDGEEADQAVADTIIGQDAAEGTAMGIYFSTHFERHQKRYDSSRGLRDLFVEVPAHAHRFILIATAFGYRNFLTPAMRDTAVDDRFDLDGFTEAITYFVGVGE